MIELVNAYKTYSGLTYKKNALCDVSLKISRGDFLAITGKSGSGKSTLLNIIGCLDKLSDGKYELDGINVGELSMNKLDKLRKEKKSFVFQNYALMNDYSVRENIELPLNARRIKGRQKKRIVDEALERMGITEIEKLYPGSISGGEQQRTAIARAYVTGTDYILADEPTGALDGENADRIVSLFQEMNRAGKTVIIVTHDLDVASKCDYIINLSEGRIMG